MFFKAVHFPVFQLWVPAMLAGALTVNGQTPAAPAAPGTPRVVVPTNQRSPAVPTRQPSAPATRIIYPWKLGVTCTVFWIGEKPTDRNPTPNCKSSWDQEWSINFGGYDDPDPANRIANHTTGEFRPKGFVPKLNPFYVALPYNDVVSHKAHKPEASRVIPWFSRVRPAPGETVCKGRWVQLHRNGRTCYAQWEDCGPWTTDDWEYVFGKKPPKTTQNGSAGIDLSPSVRDYIGIKSGQKLHWRFVEEAQVPYGPWKKYGQKTSATGAGNDLEAQRRYIERLRKMRDEQFLKKPVGQ